MQNIVNILIIVNILVFIAEQQMPNMVFYFGMNELFFKQQWWFQGITNMFLHGSIMHLGMNMVVLFQIGAMMRNRITKIFFISIYIIGGITTSILSLIFTLLLDMHINMIGASGGVSVLFGFYGFMQKEYLKGFSVAILLMSFAPLFLGVNIAWYSHIIGFLIGISIAILYTKTYLRKNIEM